uniref:C2H2-type domain-containing protein n=1 Tax=Timema cristinae TaxID=61476 RepID=A0A7R9GPL7_TIMCR|nr:unnamed protein product [Timema cristinae]
MLHSKPTNEETGDKDNLLGSKANVDPHLVKGTDIFQCQTCGVAFLTEEEVVGHVQVVHFPCKYCAKVCEKRFPLQKKLDAHARIHDPEHRQERVTCEICGRSYQFKTTYMRHMRTHIDSESQTFMCDVCGKRVMSRVSLRHHRRLHTGERPFVCDTCGKPFNSSGILRVHKRSHTGEKPYSCENCGKSFTQRSTLVVHMRYHTGERPYECHLCTKSFVTKTLLGAHLKIHS